MIDSRTAAQVAIYSALNVVALTDQADVWQDAPEGTEPSPRGLVVIGLASISNMAGKDGGFDEVTIDVLAYLRKPDATAIYALSTSVRNLIEGQPMTAAGAAISRPEFVSAEAEQWPDGETYQDRLTFRMFVQSA